MIGDMKLRRDLWRYIAVRCDRCGWVDTFEQRMNRAVHHVKEVPTGYVWSECSHCHIHEVVLDPGTALLLEPL